jgi:hypothetical protein
VRDLFLNLSTGRLYRAGQFVINICTVACCEVHMPIVDADTHVDETEATWEYLREHEEAFKPVTQYPSRVDPGKHRPAIG